MLYTVTITHEVNPGQALTRLVLPGGPTRAFVRETKGKKILAHELELDDSTAAQLRADGYVVEPVKARRRK